VLVSVLDENGVQSIVERANILPSKSNMAAVDDLTLQTVVNSSTYKSKYSIQVEGKSAYEQLAELSKQVQNEETTEAQEEKGIAKAKTSSNSFSGRKSRVLLKKPLTAQPILLAENLGKSCQREFRKLLQVIFL